ncbi:MAG: helix-turn-helix domain-containing protein [Coriobacteriia bacterium]|nr:helix-turn-helix domain-containing protein [Coriobacteriia bacterium]
MAPRTPKPVAFAKLPDVLTLQQAANYLQISDQSARYLCNTRQLPARKVGKQWRIGKAHLSKWIDGGPHE